MDVPENLTTLDLKGEYKHMKGSTAATADVTAGGMSCVREQVIHDCFNSSEMNMQK